MKNTTKFKKLSENDFQDHKRKAKSKSFSDWAMFHNKLNGYRLFKNETPLLKWEAWELGYKNANKIITGDSNIKAVEL